MAFANATTVFIVVPIEDVVTAIFDGPVAPVGAEDPLRVGLIRGTAGDTLSDFLGILPGLFLYDFPFDDEGLSDVREIKVGVEFGGGPDLAGFDPTVVRRRILHKIGFLAVLEEKGDVF